MGLRDAERALFAGATERLLAIVEDGAVFGLELNAPGLVFGLERQKAPLLGRRGRQPQLEVRQRLPICFVGRQVVLDSLQLLLIFARETGLFGDRGGEFRLQQRNAIGGLAFPDQERQLVLFRPSLELGGFLPVVCLPLLAARDVRREVSGQTLPFGLVFLDLSGSLLVLSEHLFELLARACLPFFEPGVFLAVLSLPPLAIRDMRFEGRGQAVPFGLRLVDLRGEVLTFGERLGELLARRFLSFFEPGTCLPVLSLPLLAFLVLRLEGGGQTLPFGLRLLDLRGQVLALGERLGELFTRAGVSFFEPGVCLPVLSLPPLAIRHMRLEGGGQALPFGLRLLDLRGDVLAFGERLSELLARRCLSFFEPGALLPVLGLPLLTFLVLRLQGGGQTLPFGLRLLDLRGQVLALGERLGELFTRAGVSFFEPGAFLPVLDFPPLAIRHMRLEGGGQALPLGLRLLDLRGDVLAFGERLDELLARRCLPFLEPGVFLPVLSLPLLAFRVLRLEGGGQALPFGPRLLDLRGQVLAFGERLCELLARAGVSFFEPGAFFPVLSLPLLALRVLRLEGGGQTLPFRLVLLDLRGQMLAFGERLLELLARRCLSVFELGTFLPIFNLPLLALVVFRLEGGGQTLPFRLVLLDLRGQMLAFGERLGELLAGFCSRSFPAVTARGFFLEGGLEPVRERGITEAEQ